MLKIEGHVVGITWFYNRQMYYTALSLAYYESAGGRRDRPIQKNIPRADLE